MSHSLLDSLVVTDQSLFLVTLFLVVFIAIEILEHVVTSTVLALDGALSSGFLWVPSLVQPLFLH